MGFALHWDETLRSLDTWRFEPLTICDTFGKNWDIFQMQFWDTIMFEPIFGITWNSWENFRDNLTEIPSYPVTNFRRLAGAPEVWRGEHRPGGLVRNDVFWGVSDAVGRTSFFQGQSQSCEGFDISSDFLFDTRRKTLHSWLVGTPRKSLVGVEKRES